MYKQIYRSGRNKVFSGLVGGIGEYFDIDPVVLRLGWVVLTAFTGFVPGIIAYAIGTMIVPRQNSHGKHQETHVPQD